MNTIEVGLVVELADELFYAIDSTRMASIEYGIVNSKVSAHTISLLDDFIKGAYIVSSNLKIIKKNNQKLALIY